MYPSVTKEYLKSPEPSAPPTEVSYNQPPATGIPVIAPPSSSYNYVEHNSQTPQPQQYEIQTNIPSGPYTGKWSTGLCGCGSDCSSCCMTCLCPCVTFGQISEIIDKGSTPCAVNAGLYAVICLVTGCACVYASFNRTKMRRQYKLPERPCADFLVHFCCECCALSQEYRHLKSLGFDLSIGWRGNMEEKQHLGMTMSPVVPHGMRR